MSEKVSVEEMENSIRMIYKADPNKGDVLVQMHLDTALHGFSPEERIAFLKVLRSRFEPIDIPSGQGVEEKLEDEVFSSLFSLLLGRRVSKPDLSSIDLLQKLASSLNTIFDNLNELVGVIRGTFMGQHAELETIRQIIGSDLKGTGESQSLESYLHQIKEAFLFVNQAFKMSVKSEVGKILAGLDPQQLESEAEKGIKFGFMRKAELFDVYQAKFEQCWKWFESDRFTEDFSREFEKACQKMYKEKGGAK